MEIFGKRERDVNSELRIGVINIVRAIHELPLQLIIKNNKQHQTNNIQNQLKAQGSRLNAYKGLKANIISHFQLLSSHFPVPGYCSVNHFHKGL